MKNLNRFLSLAMCLAFTLAWVDFIAGFISLTPTPRGHLREYFLVFTAAALNVMMAPKLLRNICRKRTA